MTTSKRQSPELASPVSTGPGPASLFVWIWLPDATEPVVAGQVVRDARSDIISFGYGRSYLARESSIALFEPDLPLLRGLQAPPGGHLLAPVLRDALPDRWGRRVIVNELFGHRRDEIHEDGLGEMTYMARSGSDRIGALDFQASATDYVERTSGDATLEELQAFADLV
jgi:serine/threonine-protein kinase HipA